MKRRWIAGGSALMLAAGAATLASRDGGVSEAISRVAYPGQQAGREMRDPTGAERAAHMRKAREWYEKLTAERPELQIHYREIADKDNGLLQFQKLLGGPLMDPEMKVPDGLHESLQGTEPWDTTAATAFLAGKEELLDRLEEIGLMPDQSCRGVDIARFAENGHTTSVVSDLMVTRARLALENGDAESSRKTLRALQGLACHLGQSEGPSLLTAVMGEGLRQMGNLQIERAANSAGSEEEARQWLDLMSDPPMPERGAILRGDWNASAATVDLPTLLGEGIYTFMNGKRIGEGTHFQPSDPDAAAALWADVAAAQVRDAQGTSGTEILARSGDWNGDEATAEIIAKADPDLAEFLTQSTKMENQILKATVMARSQFAQKRAAVEVAWGKEPGPEPVSGKPFRVDSSARMVEMPESDYFQGQQPVSIPTR